MAVVDLPFLPPADVELEPVIISLAGAPQGKGRARSFIKGNGRIGSYTPERTRTYEGMIRTAAMAEMVGRQPLDQPLEIVLRAIFPIPKSWSLHKQAKALVGEIKPTGRPDLDNIAKAWKDALNGVVYRDDSLIVRATMDKRYGQAPAVVVTVRGLR